MVNQAQKKLDEKKKERSQLVRGSLTLTVAMWELVLADAERDDRSESYIIRDIVGNHYGLPVELIHPRTRARNRKEKES